jgi:hypothetical protein
MTLEIAERLADLYSKLDRLKKERTNEYNRYQSSNPTTRMLNDARSAILFEINKIKKNLDPPV